MGPPSAPVVPFLKWDQILVYKCLSCEYRPYHLHPHISHLIFVCHGLPIHCSQQPIIMNKSDHSQLTIFKIPWSEIGSISTGASCWLPSRTTEVPAKDDDINRHDYGDPRQRSSFKVKLTGFHHWSAPWGSLHFGQCSWQPVGEGGETPWEESSRGFFRMTH